MTKAHLSPCLGSPALCYLPVCTCAQWYLTLCNPVDGILPGSSVHGIFQARILELVAISYSRTSSQLRDKNSCLFCLLHWQADSLSLAPPASSLAHLGEEKMPRESKKKTFSLILSQRMNFKNVQTQSPLPTALFGELATMLDSQ